MEKAKEEIVKNKVEKGQLTIKNSDIDRLEATGAFDHLCSCRELPVELSFELKKLKALLLPILQAFSQQKMEVIEKYGDRDEENRLINTAPNTFKFTKKVEEFQRDFNRFLQLESKIGFERLTMVLGEDIPDRYLSANDQEALECLVEFKMKE